MYQMKFVKGFSGLVIILMVFSEVRSFIFEDNGSICHKFDNEISERRYVKAPLLGQNRGIEQCSPDELPSGTVNFNKVPLVTAKRNSIRNEVHLKDDCKQQQGRITRTSYDPNGVRSSEIRKRELSRETARSRVHLSMPENRLSRNTLVRNDEIATDVRRQIIVRSERVRSRTVDSNRISRIDRLHRFGNDNRQRQNYVVKRTEKMRESVINLEKRQSQVSRSGENKNRSSRRSEEENRRTMRNVPTNRERNSRGPIERSDRTLPQTQRRNTIDSVPAVSRDNLEQVRVNQLNPRSAEKGRRSIRSSVESSSRTRAIERVDSISDRRISRERYIDAGNRESVTNRRISNYIRSSKIFGEEVRALQNRINSRHSTRNVNDFDNLQRRAVRSVRNTHQESRQENRRSTVEPRDISDGSNSRRFSIRESELPLSSRNFEVATVFRQRQERARSLTARTDITRHKRMDTRTEQSLLTLRKNERIGRSFEEFRDVRHNVELQFRGRTVQYYENKNAISRNNDVLSNFEKRYLVSQRREVTASTTGRYNDKPRHFGRNVLHQTILSGQHTKGFENVSSISPWFKTVQITLATILLGQFILSMGKNEKNRIFSFLNVRALRSF